MIISFIQFQGYINNKQFNIGCVIAKIYKNNELTELLRGNENDTDDLISESKIHLLKSGINGCDKFNWIGNVEGTVVCIYF